MTVTANAADIATVNGVLDNFFIFVCAVLVFFMHTGFAMLEVGGVQAKNRQSILMKNVMLVATSAISFWAIGFILLSSSKPGDENAFMGTDGDNAFLNKVDKNGANLINWFFGWAFAATAATIVSGCVAERTNVKAYVGYSIGLTAVIYPVVAYWGWNDDGWLKKAGGEHDTNKGYVDFAGSGIVHMVGGCAGLVAAALVGPRKFMDDGQGGYMPRFEEDGSVNQPIQPASSLPFSTIGTLILWVGWYGFNPGSQLAISGANIDGVGLAAVNTTLGAAAAAVGYLLLSFLATPDLSGILNAALGGLVSVTANCHCIEPWAAVIIGMCAALVYAGSSRLLKILKIDDVIDASPVHYFCGMWGVLATGLFGSDELLAGHEAGAFYGGDLIKWQLCGVVAITAWTAGCTLAILAPFYFTGLLRLSEEDEKLGLDKVNSKNGAYPITTPTPSGKVNRTLKSDPDGEPNVTLEVVVDETVKQDQPENTAAVEAPRCC
jgi:Amt family ammonium transporter